MRGRFCNRRGRLAGVGSIVHLFLWPVVAVYGAGALGVRLNVTPSVPIGLYQVSNDPTASFVEFCPPSEFGPLSVEREYRGRSTSCLDHGEPLLKPIIAREGDAVEVSSEGISVNGTLIPNTVAKKTDTAGRILTAWPQGMYSVEAGTVWVVSRYNPRSFDSRYFGPIRVGQIKNHLQPLWTAR
jgi:conjugative transfer signal peptidase TraF